MWEIGRPNLIWRWAPCGALALGAVAFASFVTFAIPDRIGDAVPNAPHGSLYATTLTPAGSNALSPSRGARESINTLPAAPPPRSGPIATAPPSFPRRGFSPPLERVETASVPAPPSMPRQPELNIPPPAPAEASPPAQPVPVPPLQAPPVPPPQAELVPQPAAPPASEPAPAPTESVAAPAPAAEPPTAAN